MIDEKKLAELFVERVWSAHGYEMLTTIDALLKIARAAQSIQIRIKQSKAHINCELRASDLDIRELESALSALKPVDKKETP